MATEDARKLFMAGLPDSATEEVLRGLFVETGAKVTELTLPRDRNTGRPRGFAFVRLDSESEAERARQELDGRIIDGRMISVRPFHTDPPAGGRPERTDRGGPGERPPRPEPSGDRGDRGGDRPFADRGERSFDRPPGGDRPFADRRPPGGFSAGPGGGPGARGPGPDAQDRTLYVGNLPYDASSEEIDALLRNAGAEGPARVYLPLDQDGRKRGFGFVTMASAEAANAALEALRGADLRGRRLIINIAHPKGERPARPEGGAPPREGGGPGGPPGGGPGGGPGGFSGDRPPRSFGPPAGGPPPPSRSGKGEGRKRRFETEGERGADRRREREDENWRDRDDDDW